MSRYTRRKGERNGPGKTERGYRRVERDGVKHYGRADQFYLGEFVSAPHSRLPVEEKLRNSVNTNLVDADFQDLRMAAAQDGQTLSQYIRMLLIAHVERVQEKLRFCRTCGPTAVVDYYGKNGQVCQQCGSWFPRNFVSRQTFERNQRQRAARQ